MCVLVCMAVKQCFLGHKHFHFIKIPNCSKNNSLFRWQNSTGWKMDIFGRMVHTIQYFDRLITVGLFLPSPSKSANQVRHSSRLPLQFFSNTLYNWLIPIFHLQALCHWSGRFSFLAFTKPGLDTTLSNIFFNLKLKLLGLLPKFSTFLICIPPPLLLATVLFLLLKNN